MKGMVLLLILLAVVVTGSFIVYMQSGPMPIEERFSQAVGLSDNGEPGTMGETGLSFEGNFTLYAIILFVLVIICIALYRYGKI